MGNSLIFTGCWVGGNLHPVDFRRYDIKFKTAEWVEIYSRPPNFSSFHRYFHYHVLFNLKMFQDIHDGGDDHNDVTITLDIKIV